MSLSPTLIIISVQLLSIRNVHHNHLLPVDSQLVFRAHFQHDRHHASKTRTERDVPFYGRIRRGQEHVVFVVLHPQGRVFWDAERKFPAQKRDDGIFPLPLLHPISREDQHSSSIRGVRINERERRERICDVTADAVRRISLLVYLVRFPQPVALWVSGRFVQSKRSPWVFVVVLQHLFISTCKNTVFKSRRACSQASSALALL
mmetsp:Transcript_24865/g.56128  ORF Transcript_24865/g.56128 Transcript_24865/m.56128 type:complete len:204 (-) Transcript_24865:258-869(-)